MAIGIISSSASTAGVHFPPNNDVADNLSHEMKVEEGFEGRIFDYKEMANLYLAQKNGATTYSGLSSVMGQHGSQGPTRSNWP